MSSIPIYTPSENITRVEMEHAIKFVVVEGSDDVPTYESVLNTNLKDANSFDWDVIHVGGKTNIKKLIEEVDSENYICIADKDFDPSLNYDNLLTLNRYSIENFYICEEAISAALAIALKAKYKDVIQIFSLREFFNEVETGAKKLLLAIYYHHHNIAPSQQDRRISWSDKCLNRNPPEWGICPKKVDNLIAELIPSNIGEDEMLTFFENSFNSTGVVAFDLPGKMLRVLLQRYVYNFYKLRKKGGAQFKSPDSFSATISGVLNRSGNFVEFITPIIEFLQPENKPIQN